MKTLTIKDLAVSCELDHKQMAHVRGGHGTSMPWMLSYSPTYDSSIKANQNLTQVQNVLNETADGSAFVSGVTANNNTSQFGQNNLLVI